MNARVLALLAAGLLAITSTGCAADTDEDDDEIVDDTADAEQALSASSWANAFQLHDLQKVNAYRAKKGLPKLSLSKKLSTFAAAGSKQLSKDHTPHAHFMAAAKSGALWNDGFKRSAAENQGDPDGWPRLAAGARDNETAQIDAIQAAMYAEGPGAGEAHGHYMNMMNPKLRLLGVGLLSDSTGKLYLTNDFSE